MSHAAKGTAPNIIRSERLKKSAPECVVVDEVCEDSWSPALETPVMVAILSGEIDWEPPDCALDLRAAVGVEKRLSSGHEADPTIRWAIRSPPALESRVV
jgi:hypothetical protein